MAIRGIKKAAVAILITASLFGASACSQNNDTVYANKQQTEEANVKERVPGTIDYSFQTPPTLEDKALNKIEDVSAIEDIGELGILTTTTDKTQLHRIINGKVVWSSNSETGTIIEAEFVQSIGRTWIVAIWEKDDKTKTVAVYDAYAYGSEQASLRKKEFTDRKVYLNNAGVVMSSDKIIERYYPDSGLTAKITLPKDTVILDPTPSGYLAYQNNRVVLAAENDAGWNSINERPEGVSNKAINKLVGTSSSLVALEWTDEDDSKYLSFHNVSTGELVAETSNPPTLPEGYNQTIGFAENQTTAFFHNLVLDVSTKEVKSFMSPVVSVIDSVAYLENGRGYNVTDQKDLWKESSSTPVLLGFSQRQGIYIYNNDLYLINLIYEPEELSADIDSNEEQEKN